MVVPQNVREWVDRMVQLCQPAEVVWCDGSAEERERLVKQAVASGDLIPLNQELVPGCHLHRSHPSDVARTEQSTFVCTSRKDDAGPNNNWMSPADAKGRLTQLFAGCMQGRTMYVIPFLMGPPGSPLAKVGIEVTDSVYVALSMGIMTRMGATALEQLGPDGDFTRCAHSVATLDADNRYICHFPETNEVWSINSGYGGNALLGKKCLALRLASWMGAREGWLAEHMLIVGVQDPAGRTTWMTGAFPSSCGKTNLAMLVPPPALRDAGWKVFTVGDDIAWLTPGPDGRLWAVNPEYGFFGVAPGTSSKTNPNAMAAIARNTLYTNVALRPDGTPWWEGHDDPPVAGMLDWQGRPWTPGSGEKAAHPNSRFTAPVRQCPSMSELWESPHGVPIDAILFGARRPTTVPLVYEARDWRHGTLMGAMLASETTAAATGKVGVLRHDPMAMLPFCGYHLGDYWAHWLRVGERLTHPPRIYSVNWFRTGGDGTFLWPGYGDNLRVLAWITERCRGEGRAVDTVIGRVPADEAIDLEGSGVSRDTLRQLLTVDKDAWSAAFDEQADYMRGYGDRVPAALWEELLAMSRRLSRSPV
ncbi:MAG: phosphoenolpyruvate carboxykinase (GTP) [Myxococcota bacterium]